MGRSERKIRRYETDDLTILYDVERCIHAEECVHGLPQVFDPDRRPWIEPGEAPAEDVARVIRRCPTGALQYEADDPELAEEAPATNAARPAPDGPLYFAGRLRIEMPDGTVRDETRAALCRCGASRDKPFCDGSHTDSGFEASGELGDDRLGDGKSDSGAIEIRPSVDGPLVLSGPLTVEADSGGETHQGSRGALCRCGASRNKPYCDGSHAEVGWRSEADASSTG